MCHVRAADPVPHLLQSDMTCVGNRMCHVRAADPVLHLLQSRPHDPRVDPHVAKVADKGWLLRAGDRQLTKRLLSESGTQHEESIR